MAIQVERVQSMSVTCDRPGCNSRLTWTEDMGDETYPFTQDWSDTAIDGYTLCNKCNEQLKGWFTKLTVERKPRTPKESNGSNGDGGVALEPLPEGATKVVIDEITGGTYAANDKNEVLRDENGNPIPAKRRPGRATKVRVEV